MSLGAVLPIVLVIGLGGGSFYGTGYYGGGALGDALRSRVKRLMQSKPFELVSRRAHQ